MLADYDDEEEEDRGRDMLVWSPGELSFRLPASWSTDHPMRYRGPH